MTLLEELKAQHGTVFNIDVEGDDRTYTIYLKKPGKATYEAMLGFLIPLKGDSKITEAGAVAIKDLFIGGDKEVMDDEDLYNSACILAAGLLEIALDSTAEIARKGMLTELIIRENDEVVATYNLGKPKRQLLDRVIAMMNPSKGNAKYITAGELVLREVIPNSIESPLFKNEDHLISAAFVATQLVKIYSGNLKKN